MTKLVNVVVLIDTPAFIALTGYTEEMFNDTLHAVQHYSQDVLADAKGLLPDEDVMAEYANDVKDLLIGIAVDTLDTALRSSKKLIARLECCTYSSAYLSTSGDGHIVTVFLSIPDADVIDRVMRGVVAMPELHGFTKLN